MKSYVSFSSTDKDVRLVGEGGNSRIYILEREYNGMLSAAIKVPKAELSRTIC